MPVTSPLPIHDIIRGDAINDIIGSDITILFSCCGLVFMLSLESKTRLMIQEVSTRCASMVLCDKMS